MREGNDELRDIKLLYLTEHSQHLNHCSAVCVCACVCVCARERERKREREREREKERERGWSGEEGRGKMLVSL